MRFPQIGVCSLLLLTGLCAGISSPAYVHAQGPQPGPSSTSNPTVPGNPTTPSLQPSPMSQLKAFEPDPNEEYTLGGGDEISVIVAGRTELSGKYTVGPDGRISLPVAGTLDVGGMTREQAKAAVDKAYGAYFKTVSASVNIDKYGSNRVLVVGAVEHPGMMTFDQTPTLLEAVTRAGMVQQVTPLGRAATPGVSNGDSIPEECTIYRETADGQKVLNVHLRELLASGNPMADLRLRRNDKVVVPDPHERFVSVLGEVKQPGPVVLTHTSTVPSVIGQAGGLMENAGNNPTIAIVDPAKQTTRYVKWKELLTPQGVNEVALQPGELIYVPKTGIAKAGFFFQQISPFTSMMSIAALAAVQ